MKKVLILTICSVLISSTGLVSVHAMSSNNYSINNDSVNLGGGNSSSASYSTQDTVGGVGTGDSNSNSSRVHAGYQTSNIDTVITTPSPSPSVSPSTNPSSGSGSQGYIALADWAVLKLAIFSSTTDSIPSVVNIISFNAIARQNDILLTWNNSSPLVYDSVVIVRSGIFYPSNVNDGEIIFSGKAKSFIDTKVDVGTDYYYSIFVKNSSGEYSSGAISYARIGSNNITKEIPMIRNIDPIIEVLAISDFNFIQNKREIFPGLSTITVDGTKNLSIRLDYNKVPEILKTIIISLKDPNDPSKVFTFLLKINKDKTAYEATIAPLVRGGIYSMNIIVLDYKNQGLKRIEGKIRVLNFGEIISSIVNPEETKAKIIIYTILIIIALCILIKIIKR